MSNQSTSNITCKDDSKSTIDEAMRYFVTVCLAIIIAVSITGNLLVCVAFKVNKNLRTVSNYFILSLAMSDLVTTIFVMPYDLELTLKSTWKHGQTLCQFYTTVYLVSAPASTLNLLAVSIDRYRLIRDPFAYKRMTTPRRVLAVIACIWVYSLIMAFLPLVGWKDDFKGPTKPITNCTSATDQASSNGCTFDLHWDYSIMMSVLNFVIPPLIMTVIYFKIYQIARFHIRRIHRLESVTGATNGRASFTGMISAPNSRRSSRAGSFSPIQLGETNFNGTQTLLTVPQVNYKIAHAAKNDAHANQNDAHGRKNSAHAATDITHAKTNGAKKNVDCVHACKEHAHANLDQADEKTFMARMNNNEKRKSRRYSTTGTSMLRKNVKAAKSLAIIVGTFFLCWYPLTIYSMIANACYRTQATCSLPPPYVGDLLLTLGFLNSMINPFLYALHNKEFKKTYKRILGWN